MKGLFVIIPIITGTLGECLYKKLCPVPALWTPATHNYFTIFAIVINYMLI
jgi:hypothetical protein